MDLLKDIFAVLVLYKCTIEESETFQSLNISLTNINATLDILVYDNSPGASYCNKKFDKGRMKVTYINDTSNSGVSKAYNVGAEIAGGLKKKWLLILDQDTIFPLEAIKKYQEQTASNCPVHAPVLSTGNGYLSPCKYTFGRGRAINSYQVGVNSFRNRSLLNSGLMISLALYNEIGGYNESIPLDFSDHYFVNEIKKRYKYFNVLDVVCKHALSSAETDLNKILIRFKYYLIGAREYIRCNRSFPVLVVSFARTMKLTIRFKTSTFLKYYLEQIC